MFLGQIAFGVEERDAVIPRIVEIPILLIVHRRLRQQIVQRTRAAQTGIGCRRIAHAGGFAPGSIVNMLGEIPFAVQLTAKQSISVIKESAQAIFGRRSDDNISRLRHGWQGSHIDRRRKAHDVSQMVFGIEELLGDKTVRIDLEYDTAGFVVNQDRRAIFGRSRRAQTEQIVRIKRAARVRQLAGSQQRGVLRGTDQMTGRVVGVLGQRAYCIDLADFSAGRIVNDIGTGSGRITLADDAAVLVVKILGLAKHRCIIAARLDHRDQIATAIEHGRAGKTVGQRDQGLVVGVVVAEDRLVAQRINLEQQAVQTVIGVLGRIRRTGSDTRINALEQTAGLVVEEQRHSFATVHNAGTHRIDTGKGRPALQLATEIVDEIDPRSRRLVGRQQPVVQIAQSQGLTGNQGRHRIQGFVVLDTRNLLTGGVIVILDNPPLRTDLEAQMALGIVNIAGIERRGACPGRVSRRSDDGFRHDTVIRVVGPTDFVAQGIALQRHVARCVVLHGDRITVAVDHLDDVARCIVDVTRLGAHPLHRRAQGLDQLRLAVVEKRSHEAFRIGDIGPTIGRVVGVLGHPAFAIGDRRHPPHLASLGIGEAQQCPVGLAHRCQTLRSPIIGIAGGIDLAVGDAAILRRQIDQHAGQPVLVIIFITGTRTVRAGLIDNANCRQILILIIEVGRLAGSIGNRRNQVEGVVGVLDLIAVAIGDRLQEALVVVGLADSLLAILPDPVATAHRAALDDRHPAQGIVCAAAIRRDIFPRSGIVAINGLGPIGIHPTHPTACGIDRAGQLVHPLVDTQTPLVTVVAIPIDDGATAQYPLAVVGTQQGNIEAARNQQFVCVLDQQISRRCVYRHLLLTASVGIGVRAPIRT